MFHRRFTQSYISLLHACTCKSKAIQKRYFSASFHDLYIIIGRDLTRQSDRPYLVQFAPLRRRVSGDGGELIQRYAVFPQCSCSCSTHYSHLAVATYDPAIISISITPAAGKADLVPACMFTLQHVDCVGIDMRVDIDTQTFSCLHTSY